MSAVACLRVLLDGNRTNVPADRLGPLVGKYSNIFLEVRWTLPRLWKQLNDYSYLLTDPCAVELDTVELARLSQDLQVRLFGTGVENAIKLVLFQGDAEAISAFVAYSADDVLAALEDPSGLPGGGRLRRIAEDGSLIDVPEAASNSLMAEAFRFSPTVDGIQGVYFPRAASFIGDVVNCTPLAATRHYSILDGDHHRPEDAEAFDAACVMTAMRFLVESRVLVPLYIPVSFSTLIRPARREAWLDLVAVLPVSERTRLAAAVYNVPRAPTFQALRVVRMSLDRHFGAVDLCVRDADFQIQQLAAKDVVSVTFSLPEARPDVRLAALRRFASHAADYRKRRIAAGLTNVRSRHELVLAVELNIAFVSGPGVCGQQSEPSGGQSWPLKELPLHRLAATTREMLNSTV